MHQDSRSHGNDSGGHSASHKGLGHGHQSPLPPSQRPQPAGGQRSLLSSSSWASSTINTFLGKAQPEKMPLQRAKLHFELTLQDYGGHDIERLRYRIRGTRDVRDLWYLRSEMHTLLSKRSSQAQASEAINKLLPCFEGWLPEHQLVKI